MTATNHNLARAAANVLWYLRVPGARKTRGLRDGARALVHKCEKHPSFGLMCSREGADFARRVQRYGLWCFRRDLTSDKEGLAATLNALNALVRRVDVIVPLVSEPSVLGEDVAKVRGAIKKLTSGAGRWYDTKEPT